MQKIERWYRKFIDNTKLKKKMTGVWLASVVIILAFALYGSIKMIRAYNNMMYSVMVDSMKYAMTGISRELANYEKLGETLYRNSQVQEIFSEINDTGKVYSSHFIDLRQLFYAESSQYDYINYVIMVDETTGTVLGVENAAVISAEKKEKIITLAEEKWGRNVWTAEYGKESQVILTRKIPRISNLGKDTLATLIINIDIAALMRDTGIADQKSYQCIMVDQEGNSLSDSGEFSNEQIKEMYEQIADEKFAIVPVNGKKYFAVYQEESSGKWGYVYFTEYDNVFSKISQNLTLIMIVGAVCVLFIVILNSFFTSDLLKGFDGLIKAFQAFSEDISNHGPQEYSERKDEIGMLYQQFGLMQEKVVQLTRENYVIELEKKQAQVEMLETQINPHFLYNTLQTIDWRAKALQSKEISMMVECLSQILQTTLSNKKSFLRVEEELDLCQQFVTILQMRMHGELIYETDVEEELLSAVIPKLVIQPLVENGISYSMDAMLEVSRVQVEVKREGEDIAIWVKNTGSRFPDNLLQKLVNKEIQSTGHGIGILNIDTRIKLTYGSQYGISFCHAGEYAIAKLVIPYETEDRSDV